MRRSILDRTAGGDVEAMMRDEDLSGITDGVVDCATLW